MGKGQLPSTFWTYTTTRMWYIRVLVLSTLTMIQFIGQTEAVAVAQDLSGCKDLLTTSACADLKNKGQCPDNGHSLCKNTCGLCPLPDCKDILERQSCADILGKGECTENGSRLCKRTCGFCPLPSHTRQCGSFASIYQLTSDAFDRIRDTAIPINDNGGMASLHDSATKLDSSTHVCGASLISDRFLLTAAHCMVSNVRSVNTVSLGRGDINIDTAPGPDTYKIEEVYIHPAYQNINTGDYNDIAIIRTDRIVKFSSNIWPFCLPEKNLVLDEFTLVQIAGWGLVNQTHSSPKLQIAFVNVVDNVQCELLWRQHASEFYEVIISKQYPQGFTNLLICAGRQGVDACSGDSGGPLSYHDSNGHHTVVGIIAKGAPGCKDSPLLPGFYTRIINYIDWIYEKTQISQTPAPTSNLPEPRPVSVATVSPGSDCKTYPDERPGDCIDIQQCPALNSLLQQSNGVETLRGSVCGNTGSKLLVCCSRTTTPKPTSTSLPRPPSVSPRQCGFNSNTDRIVGGENAELASWPWMVLLRGSLIGDELSNWLCGGVLITEQYVLTAAHCVTDNIQIEFARIGEFDLSKNPDVKGIITAPQPQDIHIDHVIRHPQYNSPCRRCNDIALIKLSRPADLVPLFVQPICLPANPEQDMGYTVSEFQRKTAYTAGWGSTSENAFIYSKPDILQQVNLTIQELDYCREQKGSYPDGRMILCAGQGDGKDFCRGDLGGPLMLKDYKGLKWYVVGVVSFGPTICGDRSGQSGFTSVHYYMDWINQNIL